MRAVLVVLEGIDGAGKSTLAAGLRDRLAAAGPGPVELWRKKDVEAGPPALRAHLRGLRDLLWGDPAGEPDVDVLGTRHYLFLHAAWFAAVTSLRVVPLRADPRRSAVVDGWYYRSVAKAVLRAGVSEPWALSLFEDGDPPDVVVLLDVDPRVAWERRGGVFSASETGRWDGEAGDPRAAYLAYQGRVRALLLTMAARSGWCVVRPDPGWTPQEVLEHTVARVAGQVASTPA